MTWFSGWAAWLILGFALLILEVVLPSTFIMWWGFAAVAVAAIVALIPDLALSWQIAAFACLAIVLTLLWWFYQHQKDRQEDQRDTLNHRDHAMLGAQGQVVQILSNGVARGKFGDTTWRMLGSELRVGDTVKVVAVDGITLMVKKA